MDARPSSDPPPTWSGWRRVPPGGWECICSAPTWGECWTLLLQANAPGKLVEKLVTRLAHPDRRQRPR
jgi:hypothetical protein